jgi:hypothetical protein
LTGSVVGPAAGAVLDTWSIISGSFVGTLELVEAGLDVTAVLPVGAVKRATNNEQIKRCIVQVGEKR